jgi:hypothetical protein
MLYSHRCVDGNPARTTVGAALFMDKASALLLGLSTTASTEDYLALEAYQRKAMLAFLDAWRAEVDPGEGDR